ncbi:MAG: hypothetical protein K0S04_338 [Herbinix sp.]|nr:hypothetical protein [Herbinix sp.]
MIYEINNTPVKTPSSCTWGLNYISVEDSGRTLDGEMHIDPVTTKRKLDNVAWNGLDNVEAAAILQLVNQKRFMTVKYDDALTNTVQTRTFYIGDPTAQTYSWRVGNKIFSSLAFNFIEK